MKLLAVNFNASYLHSVAKEILKIPHTGFPTCCRRGLLGLSRVSAACLDSWQQSHWPFLTLSDLWPQTIQVTRLWGNENVLKIGWQMGARWPENQTKSGHPSREAGRQAALFGVASYQLCKFWFVPNSLLFWNGHASWESRHPFRKFEILGHESFIWHAAVPPLPCQIVTWLDQHVL